MPRKRVRRFVLCVRACVCLFFFFQYVGSTCCCLSQVSMQYPYGMYIGESMLDARMLVEIPHGKVRDVLAPSSFFRANYRFLAYFCGFHGKLPKSADTYSNLEEKKDQQIFRNLRCRFGRQMSISCAAFHFYFLRISSTKRNSL